MPLSAARDIVGSTLTKGYGNGARRGRAVRRFLVRDPNGTIFDNTNADINTAINKIVSEEGNKHPSFNLIRLADVRAERLGVDKVSVSLVYRALPGGGGGFGSTVLITATYTTQENFQTVWRSAFFHDDPPDAIGVYDEAGLPDGNILGVPADPALHALDARPQERRVSVGQITIHVRTRLEFDPYGSPSFIGQFEDKINIGNVILGLDPGPFAVGKVSFRIPGVLGPHSVRFDGAEVSERQTSGPLKFDIVYRFSIRRKFWHQNLQEFDPATGWNVFATPSYQAVNMQYKFPLPRAGRFLDIGGAVAEP